MRPAVVAWTVACPTYFLLCFYRKIPISILEDLFSNGVNVIFEAMNLSSIRGEL